MYSSDDEDLPAKRPKLFRACVQCVTAKTRCEDVKLKGCGVCRRKRRPCSLAGAVTALPDYDGATGAAAGPRSAGGGGSRRSSMQPPVMSHPSAEGLPGQDAETRITDLERRLAVQERELHELRSAMQHPRAGGSDTQALSTLDPRGADRRAGPAPAHTEAVEEGGQRYSRLVQLTHFAQLEDFSETLFALSTPDAYPSAVDAGILEAAEVDLAFQLFKHRFSTILPLAPFLSITTPAPATNFVILAVLHHVPSYASSQLARLVDESIITALTGNISLDVILGFLILSLAPAIPSRKRDRPSPLRLISLAYQFGQDLGIDGKVDHYLVRGTDLALPFWSEAMHMVQVWTAVINRYNILHLLHGHGRPLPSSPATLIPQSADHNVQHSTNHLLDEYHLSQLALDAMRPLIIVEAGQHDFEEVKRGMQIFQAGMEALIAWKRSSDGSPQLDLDQRCLEHIAVLRLSFLFQRIPSPLQPIRQTLLNGMSIFVVTAQRFIATLFPQAPAAPSFSPHFLRSGEESVFNSPYSSSSGPAARQDPTAPNVPAHVTMCALLAVLSLRGTAAHVRWREPGVPLTFINLPQLVRAEEYLRQLGGRMVALLDQADMAFGTISDAVAASMAQEAVMPEIPMWQQLPPPQSGSGDPRAAVPSVAGAHGAEPFLTATSGFDWNDVALGTNNLFNPGFFDVDLFSWDPSFLAPDWIPEAPLGTAGVPRDGSALASSISPAGSRTEAGGMTAVQQEWRNALR